MGQTIIANGDGHEYAYTGALEAELYANMGIGDLVIHDVGRGGELARPPLARLISCAPYVGRFTLRRHMPNIYTYGTDLD